MNIACIGTGFVGVVTSAVFAKLGNNVVGLDIDEKKVESLKQGIVPFFEPGLQELLVETQKTGKLTFTTNYASAISSADIVMIMVGTPSSPDGQADLDRQPVRGRSSRHHRRPETALLDRMGKGLQHNPGRNAPSGRAFSARHREPSSGPRRNAEPRRCRRSW